MSGVQDPLIDQLIDSQKTEMNLDKRNEILKKIDRRLNEIIPYVFLWQSDNHRLLYWNRFGTPEFVLDKYNREDVIITYWWVDAEKDNLLNDAKKKNITLQKLPEKIVYSE